MKLKDVNKLLADGKIRGITDLGSPGLKKKASGSTNAPRILTTHRKGLQMALEAFCRERGLPLFREQMFHVQRKWRFDYLIPGCRVIAIEYEGLGYGKTGHTESHRYTDNTDKYNAAAAAGITVLRYTFANWQQCVEELKIFVYGY